MNSQTRLVAIAAIVTLALVACTTDGFEDPPDDPTSVAPTGSTQDAAPIEVSPDIPQREAALTSAQTRLAEGLATPTNKWFSGLVFGDAPQPVFPSPLGFIWTDNGFSVGVPEIADSEITIFGAAVGDVAVDLGTDDMIVSAYDDASVTVTALDGDTAVADVTIAQGWPAVQVTAAQADVTVPVPVTEAGEAFTVDGVDRWGVAGADLRADGGSLTIPAGASAIFFAAPEGGAVADVAEHFGSGLTTVTASAVSDGNDVTTTLTYAEQDTLLVPPATVDGGCSEPGYATIWGDAPACVGTQLSWSVPVTTAVPSLDVSVLSEQQREQILELIPADVDEVIDPSAWPADSYFGSKAMYRAAMLADLAGQLGDTESADALWAALTEQLMMWADPAGCEARSERCVLYDTSVGGYLALAPSFGSDEFNDHHFHYGYLVYAAAMAVANDPDLVAELEPVINAYVADIASPVATDMVPRNRTFDPYWGHSWASGYSPFSDGNNQESVSEAMLAWTGVSLWAQATDNDGLAANAQWLLSAETESARTQWLEPDLSHAPAYSGEVATLVWGGKVDYATWFSAEPSAKLGILLIPMSPTMVTIGVDPERITASVEQALPGGNVGPLGDYAVMYSALTGADAADEAVQTLLDLPEIDGAMTRSYAVAWTMVAGASAG